MENYLRMCNEAASTLEDLLPDLADAAENVSETKKVSEVCNRLAGLINQVRQQLR